MLTIGIVLLALAILCGLVLAKNFIKNRKPPRLVVFLHGAFALSAIFVMAAYVAAGHTDTLLITSLVLFILGAFGGLTMLMFDLKNKNIPKSFLMVHPLIGLAGFVTLVVYMIQSL